MAKKIVAIVGTYRKGHIIDSAVDELLNAAKVSGAQTEKIYLLDKYIEFCTNCRKCTQRKINGPRDKCVHNDDMGGILTLAESADCVVLASPVNFFSVTALMKRFIERFIVYAYWPWEAWSPKSRQTKKNNEAVLIISSACPAFIGRLLISSAPFKIMKSAAELLGAKVIKKIYLGTVALTENQPLLLKYKTKLQSLGRKLAQNE